MAALDIPATKVPSAKFVAGATTLAALPPATFGEIAFAGRSNVGKSSLLNALLTRKNLVRTSRTPGVTRQINFFETCILHGKEERTLNLVDLPGYGFAKVSKSESKSWGPLMDGYLVSRTNLRAVVILVDIRRGLEEEEFALAEFMATRVREAPVVVVATKADRIAKNARKPALMPVKTQTMSIKARGPYAVSAETGEGIDALWATLFSLI
jgi:GTP-binding protein